MSGAVSTYKDRADASKTGVQGAEAREPSAQIPIAALKRFAHDLEEDPQAKKFLQLNMGRVNQFVETKPLVLKHHGQKPGNVARTLRVPGTWDYTDMNSPAYSDKNTILQLQNIPEFQKSLGARSRFGEGDGSFFDQWLNSDVTKTKHLYDKDGFPLMKYSAQSHSGFKKHLSDFKAHGGEAERGNYVRTYAKRREERRREEEAKSAFITDGAPELPSLVHSSVLGSSLDGFVALPLLSP
jgi:hypothetical protein